MAAYHVSIIRRCGRNCWRASARISAATPRLQRLSLKWKRRSPRISAARLAAREIPVPVAKVHRISANGPDDASGIADAIERGEIDPRGVIAVFGKTEGNGCVNDFSRGFA